MAPTSELIDDPDYFTLVLTRFTPRPKAEESRINSVTEFDEKLAPVQAEPLLFVGLSCMAEGAEGGAFSLFLSGDRAWIHLMEGRCLTGKDPESVRHGPDTVRFQDDGGNWHDLALSDTVS